MPTNEPVTTMLTGYCMVKSAYITAVSEGVNERMFSRREPATGLLWIERVWIFITRLQSW